VVQYSRKKEHLCIFYHIGSHQRAPYAVVMDVLQLWVLFLWTKIQRKKEQTENKNLARKRVGENLKEQTSMRKTVPNWECNPSKKIKLWVHIITMKDYDIPSWREDRINWSDSFCGENLNCSGWLMHDDDVLSHSSDNSSKHIRTSVSI